ncbi:MAG: Rieske (2Fe-2S) protein [Vicinamibacterales bacterium]
MDRRRALAIFVNSAIVLIGGALTTVLAAFALRPSREAVTGRWLRAGPLADLTPNVQVPKILAMSRQDGWYRQRARETVFLVWDGDKTVHALSATCTHLGCQVRWDVESTKFRCPCHGGVFGIDGSVVEGPPPRPLDRVDARIDPAGTNILVRL